MMVPKIPTTSPGVGYGLGARPTVHIHQNGVLFVFIKICRLQQVTVQQGAIDGFDSKNSLWEIAKLARLSFRFLLSSNTFTVLPLDVFKVTVNGSLAVV